MYIAKNQLQYTEIITGIEFDEITSKSHFKNMMEFNLTKCQHVAIFQVQN